GRGNGIDWLRVRRACTRSSLRLLPHLNVIFGTIEKDRQVRSADIPEVLQKIGHQSIVCHAIGVKVPVAVTGLVSPQRLIVAILGLPRMPYGYNGIVQGGDILLIEVKP